MNNYYQQPYNPYMPRYGVAGGITWVQGVEGAKAYQLAPSSSAVLMDSEIEGRMYIKTVDNIGISALRYFQYTEVSPEATRTTQGSDYATKADLEEAIEKLKGELKHEQPVSADMRKNTADGSRK